MNKKNRLEDRKFMKQSRIDSFIDLSIAFSFLFLIGIRPVYKLLEANELVPRINISIIEFLLLCIILSALILKVLKNKKVANPGAIYTIGLLLLTMVIFLQLIQAPFLIYHPNVGIVMYLKTISITIIASVLMWLAGQRYSNIYSLFSTKMWITTFFIFLLFVGVIFYIVIAVRGGTFDFQGFRITTGKVGNYLMISDGLAILLLLMLSIIKEPLFRILFAVFGAFLLLGTLSRTSLYAYIASVIVIYMAKVLRNWRAFVITAVMFLLILGSGLSITNDIMPYSQDRMFRVVFDLNSDSSYNKRTVLMERGMEDLKDNWLLGSFMLEAKDGRPGSYIHNWLSFWIEYGIIPFIIFCLLFVFCFIRCMKCFFINPNDGLTAFIFSTSFFVLTSIVIARSYNYPYVWFCAASMSLMTDSMNQMKLKSNKQSELTLLRSLKTHV